MTTLTIPRGATKSWTFTVAGDNVDLTTSRVYFTAKVLGEGVNVIAKANDAGGGNSSQIEVLDATRFRLKFIPADTSAIAVTTTLFYDAWFVTALGEYVQVVEESHLKIGRAVTTSFPTP